MHRTRLNDFPDDTESDNYETDYGMMDGDDGGYSNFHQLCQEEEALRNAPSGVYRLLGEPVRKSDKKGRNTAGAPSESIHFKYGEGQIANMNLSDDDYLVMASTGILAVEAPGNERHGTDDNFLEESKTSTDIHDRQSRRLSWLPKDVFDHSIGGPSLMSSDSTYLSNILEIIGDENVVVRTVQTVEEVYGLRRRVFNSNARDSSLSAATKSGGAPKGKTEPLLVKLDELDANTSAAKKPDYTIFEDNYSKAEPKLEKCKDVGTVDVFEISNTTTQPDSRLGYHVESRQRAMGHGICALLAVHAGFTHTSTRALHILTDMLEHFLWNIGKILQTSRIESEIENIPIIEQMRIIGNCGFRGGLADLMCYARSDLVFAEQAILEARQKLRVHLGEHEGRSKEKTRKIPGNGTSLSSEGLLHCKKELFEYENYEATVNSELFLNDDAFSFGYLNPNVHLDVLNGVKVPKKLVYSGHLKEEQKLKQEETDLQPTDFDAIETDEQSQQWLESMGLQ